MKNRSPAAVFFLALITFGIYSLVWHVKTKNELNKLGAEIPTAWLLIVPIAQLYWVWKYAEGVEKVTGGKISAVLVLILLLLLNVVGIAILQSEYNKLGAAPASAGPDVASAPAPVAPVAPTAPAATPQSFAPPQVPATSPVASAAPEQTDNPVTVTPTEPTPPVSPTSSTPPASI